MSIVLNDGDAAQVELGRMSTMVVDDDVMNASLPELGDVAVEAGLVADLLSTWRELRAADAAGDDRAGRGGGGDSSDDTGDRRQSLSGLDSTPSRWLQSMRGGR